MTPGSRPSQPADHELLHVIGRGAYGEVWLARHTRLGTLRAVKIVRRDSFGDARPFQREFDGIRRYEPISRGHPNLVSILHVGGTDECFYYLMELADEAGAADVRRLTLSKSESAGLKSEIKSEPPNVGCYAPHTLRSELKQHGALPIDRVLEIGHALASALAHLHAHKLVHRDVKPSNVIFVAGVPKLADIGLVAGVDEAPSFVGTEGYIPPEGPGTPSADCYSLGKLLYELSTGHDRTAWPEPPADLATRPDRERLLELNATLHKACAPDLRQRYPIAGAMLADLRLLAEGRSVKRRRAWRNSGLLLLRAGGVTVGLLLLGWLAFPRFHPNGGPPPDTAIKLPQTVDKAKSEQLYRKARERTILNKDRFAEAIRLFHEAIAYDPDYAPSHTGRANAYVQIADWLIEPRAAMSEARASASTALKLDPRDREGLVVMGCVKVSERDWMGAELDFQQALNVDPSYVRAQFYYAWFLRTVGRMGEARELVDRALRLQPQHSLLHWGALYQSCAERKFERAFDEVRQFFGTDTNRWSDTEFWVAGWTIMHLGRLDEAIGFLETSKQRVDKPWVTASLVWALGKSERKAKAVELTAELERMARVVHVSSSDLALAYMGLGDHDRALEQMERSVAAGAGGDMLHSLNSPVWDEVRSDPRFRNLERQLRLPSPAGR
jgi:serine/threonine protein kinase